MVVLIVRGWVMAKVLPLPPCEARESQPRLTMHTRRPTSLPSQSVWMRAPRAVFLSATAEAGMIWRDSCIVPVMTKLRLDSWAAEEIAVADQRSASVDMERGLARAQAEDWPGAVEAFRSAVALCPADPEPRFRLGWALWHRSEQVRPTAIDLALGYGAQVLGMEPFASERRRKYTVHRRMLRDASLYLHQAIERKPDHADAHYYLAKAIRELGYRAEAHRLAKRAAELDPQNRRYTTLAAACSAEGSFAGEATEPATASRLTWDDVVLPDRTKRELRQMQLVLEKPDLARELGVEPPTGILLKGAPGTGKTTIARVLANEAKCRFFAITPADINQMLVGESEKRVQSLFEKARAHAPSIIFIDEIDALLPERQGGVAIHSDKVVNQFLQEMDGMSPNHRVFVVGATNRRDMLDPALLRGGRLSREIEIPLPDRDARTRMLELFTKRVHLADEVDLGAVANATDGYSGADLHAIVNEAGLQALIRIADAKDEAPKTLTAADFRAAAENLDRGPIGL